MAAIDSIALPAGTLLFSEGDPGSCAFLIKRGRIEIFLTRGDGDIVLARRGVGEIIGEMAILDERPRSASARVVEDAELTLVTAKQINHRIEETDPILRMCLGVVIDRYRETIARFDDGYKQAAVRDDAPAPQASFQAAVGMLSMESELRRALRNDELELHFQPIVELPRYRLAGFEALLRWRHPERGLIPPGIFIPVAEASGLIVEVTEWCLTWIGRKFPDILVAGLQNSHNIDALFVAVNVSGHDLARGTFAGFVGKLLRESGLAPRDLKLEVTESVLMKDPARAAATLKGCRALGLEIAIDDFGTGYSSLSLLSTLPITTIKIDRSFVSSMDSDPTSRKIIQMILRLAEELDLPVVAEGIEHAHEATTLADLGCTYGQGYHFGRPLPFDQTLAVTRGWRSLEQVRPTESGAHKKARRAG